MIHQRMPRLRSRSGYINLFLSQDKLSTHKAEISRQASTLKLCEYLRGHLRRWTVIKS